jgi:hypothetical protein
LRTRTLMLSCAAPTTPCVFISSFRKPSFALAPFTVICRRRISYRPPTIGRLPAVVSLWRSTLLETKGVSVQVTSDAKPQRHVPRKKKPKKKKKKGIRNNVKVGEALQVKQLLSCEHHSSRPRWRSLGICLLLMLMLR